MILEVAILNVRPGRATEFEQAFRQAQRIISAMAGYVSHELQRCLEVENKYVLLVRWQRLEDPTEGFRDSGARGLALSAPARVLHHAARASPGAGPHDVEVAAGVAPDAVARAEARVAPLGQALAVERQDADEPAVVLGDVDDVGGVHVERRRTDELGRPDQQELAVLVEHLDTVVLPVAHEDTPAPIDP